MLNAPKLYFHSYRHFHSISETPHINETSMKEILGNNGYAEGATGSPKTILKTAFSAGMITDEALWLDALVSRNNVAHA